MSIRSQGPVDAPPAPPEGRPAAPPAEDPDTVAARQEAAFLNEEGDAATDKSWAASVYFEAGVIQETRVRRSKAIRSYTKALSVDPSFQPSAWALRRHLLAQGGWESLLRVLDAEARFGSNTRSQDRSDLMLERGWVAANRMGAVEEGRLNLQSAVTLDPTNRAAWLALLIHALPHGATADAEQAFGALIGHARDAGECAAWAEAYASWLLMPQTDGQSQEAAGLRAQRAAQILEDAVEQGAFSPPLLARLDRLSWLLGDDNLRLRVLDRMLAAGNAGHRHPKEIAVALVATREKARRLVMQGSPLEAASLLDEALRLQPEHPLLLADRLDLAVVVGQLEVLDARLALASDSDVETELNLRRADVALAKHAWGEAMSALVLLPPDSQLHEIYFAARARALAALQEPQALAELYAEQAEHQYHRLGSRTYDSRGLIEVAHQYTRAGALWETELANGARAEALYNAALKLVPSYRPAQEGLASVYTREGRWDSLTSLVESDAQAPSSPQRETALRETLVLLYRDVLGDYESALAAQRRLVDKAPDDVRALVRLLDLAAVRVGAEAATLDDVLDALGKLHKHARTPTGRGALSLLAARLAQGGPRDGEADSWLDRALTTDPRSLAAAFIERRRGRPSTAILMALQRELEAWSRESDGQRIVRSLRYRCAFVALESGAPSEAMRALDVLVDEGDQAALAWQSDIALRAREPRLLGHLLAELRSAHTAARPSPRDLAQIAIALSEALEARGLRQEAAEAFQRALTLAPADELPELHVQAGLGVLRLAAAASDHNGLVAGYRALGAALSPSARQDFEREAEHVHVAMGGRLDSAPSGADASALALRFVSAARFGEPVARLQTVMALAEAAQPGDARASLWAHVGLVALLQQASKGGSEAASEASSHLHRSYREGASPIVEIALTELPGLAAAPAEAAVMTTRLDRLLVGAHQGDEPSGALASLLSLERASTAEASGDLPAAVEAYVGVLRLRPDSLEALEGLRRLAQLAGARSDEARLLERVADTLVHATAAAAHYAEAALLLEADGETHSAIRLFYKVLSRAPDDDEAFERLLSLLRRDQAWERLERLLGFKLTRLGHTGARCVALWLERARVRQEHLNNEAGAIADWQRTLAVDDTAFEPQWRLGQLAQSRGALLAARARFVAALAATSAEQSLVLSCEVDLAEVCSELADQHTAREALNRVRRQLDAIPSALLERILRLNLRLSMPELAADVLAVLAAREDGAGRAHHLLRRARVMADMRTSDGKQQAAQSLQQALQADAFCDAVFDLHALGLVLDAPLLSALQPAAEQVLQAVVEGKLFDVRALELLAAYSHLLGQPWRERNAGQILFLLGHGHTRGQARSISGSLDVSELLALTAANAEPASSATIGLQRVWTGLAEAVAKACLTIQPLPPIGRSTRILVDEDVRLEWLYATAQTLGLTGLVLHRAASDSTLIVAGAPSPLLIFGGGFMGGDPASRFRVARAIVLLRLGIGFTLGMTHEQALQWIFAALATVAPDRFQHADSGLRDQVVRALPRKALRSVEAVAELQDVQRADVELWLSQLQQAAARFALLVAGDVAESAFALAGSRKVDEVKKDAAVRELLCFCVSDGFGSLRARLGLASGDPARE